LKDCSDDTKQFFPDPTFQDPDPT